jgi:hypothetical protein
MALHLRITAQRSGASDSAVHTLRSPKVIPTSPCHIFPVTKKRDRLELIASADIDSRVREKGVLVIGELLKEKTARKERAFSKLSPATHAHFLGLLHSVHSAAAKSTVESHAGRWNLEFASASTEEQIAILNACAGRGLVKAFPEKQLLSLLSAHFETLSPAIAEEIAKNCCLYLLNDHVKSFNLRSLTFFSSYRSILKERMEAADLTRPLHDLRDCVYTSVSYIQHASSTKVSLFRMVACLRDAEVIELFSSLSHESLRLFLLLNNPLAQRVVTLIHDNEAVLAFWLLQMPASASKYFTIVLASFSPETQREFLFENPRSFSIVTLQNILRHFSKEQLIALCQINPDIDISSGDDSVAILDNLSEVQLLILGMVDDYHPLVARYLSHFKLDDLYILVLYSQNALFLRELLSLCADSLNDHWNSLAKAASFILSKRDFILLLTDRLRFHCLRARELAPGVNTSLDDFDAAVQLPLKPSSTESRIHSCFLEAQQHIHAFCLQMTHVKGVLNIAQECRLPKIDKLADTFLNSPSGINPRAMLQSARAFIGSASERREQALQALGLASVDSASGSTLLSWMPSSVSADTHAVTAMYEGIRASLDAIGITMDRLGELEFCYEDVLASGLRGDNMQGVTQETEFVKHMQLYQRLNELGLLDISLSLQELRELGLNLSHLEVLTTIEKLTEWKEQALLLRFLASRGLTAEWMEENYSLTFKRFYALSPHVENIGDLNSENFALKIDEAEKRGLQKALDKIALTQIILTRLRYTLDILYERGLRFDNLAEQNIQDHRTLAIFLRGTS